MNAPPTAAPGPDSPARNGFAVSRGARLPTILTARADFVRASQALRQGTPGFLLQARQRRDGEAADGIRVGFTCSRKVGNAVARNRAKRRLREIARAVIPGLGRDGWDYVLVGRQGDTASRNMDLMADDLRRALERVHGARK